MEIDPKSYENMKRRVDGENSVSQKMVDSLLKNVRLLNLKKKQFEFVVDVGSGTGQLTFELATQIPGLKKIVGCDVDRQMVAYAIQNYFSNVIDYIDQDISADFGNLDLKLIRLVGLTDLVVSNWALQWVHLDRRTVMARNIFHLLKDDGVFLANIVLMDNVLDSEVKELPEGEAREELSKVLKIPCKSEQVIEWQQLFEDAGFKQTKAEVTTTRTAMTRKQHRDVITAVYATLYKSYMVGVNQEEKAKLLDKYGEQIREVVSGWVETRADLPSDFVVQALDQVTIFATR